MFVSALAIDIRAGNTIHDPRAEIACDKAPSPPDNEPDEQKRKPKRDA
jgi:hypothetical protein